MFESSQQSFQSNENEGKTNSFNMFAFFLVSVLTSMDELLIWVCLKMDGVVLKNPLVDHVNHHFTMRDRP